MNHKRLFRVYRVAGLSVKRKKRKHLMRVGQPCFTATRQNQQWAIDFVQDRMANGRTLRVLSIVDTFTRECLGTGSGHLSAQSAGHAGARSCDCRRGRPERIRMDNGSELTSRHFLSWGIDQRIELVHIQPGKPSKMRTLRVSTVDFRDECLNTSRFETCGMHGAGSPHGETNTTKKGRTAALITARPMSSLRRVLRQHR